MPAGRWWEAPARRRRLEHGLATILVLAVVAVFFWPAIAGGRTFTTVDRHQDGIYPWADLDAYDPIVQSDEADLSLPAQALLTRSIQEDGTLPLWDPHSYGGGVPNYADGGNPVAYPPRILLAWLVDPVRAHLLFTAGHLLVAGLATYALGRRLGAGLAGSLLMATSWMFGAFNMAFLHLDQVSALAAVLPVAVLAVDRAVARGTWPAAAGAGVVLGIGLLGGHLLFMTIAVGMGLLWGAVAAARVGLADRDGTPLDRLVPLGQVAFAGVLALGTAAVMLVPTLAALGTSARQPVDHDDVAGILAPLGDALAVLAPPGELTGPTVHTQPFVGTAAAVFALVGACTRRRGVGFARGLVVAVVIASTTTPGARLFLRIPAMDAFRPLGRLSVYLAFGVVLLAGAGAAATVDAAHRWAGREERRRTIAVAVTAVVLAGATGQVLGVGRDLNPAFSRLAPEELFPPVPLVQAMWDQTAPGGAPPLVANVRLSLDGGFTPPILHGAEGVVLGIDTASGYRSSMPRRTFDLLRVLEGLPLREVVGTGALGSFVPQLISDRARFALLPRFGYELLLTTPTLPADLSWAGDDLDDLQLELLHTDATGSLYRIGAARAVRFASSVIRVDDEERALRTVADPAVDLRAATVLTDEQAERLGAFAPEAGAGGRAVLVRPDANHLTADLDTTGASIAVLPVNWDPGWSAEVDGRSAPVLRVDYGRVGIAVPAGAHRVQLAYVPPGLRLGAAATTATLVFVLEVVAWGPLQRLIRSGRWSTWRRRAGAGPSAAGWRRRGAR